MRRLRRKIQRIRSFFSLPSVKIGILVGGVLFILMFAILLVEKGVNKDLVTPFDALWYTVVTMTTIGYGDVTPITVPGRFIAFFIMMGGIVAFGAISGKIASVLLDQQQKKDKGLINLKKKQKHLIICGWQPEMETILQGILKSNPEMTPSDIVLVNNAPQESLYPILSTGQFRGINYINGDFSEEETLLRADMMNADKILILSDFSRNYSPMERDSRTVLAVLVIKKLKRTIYVAAELIDDKFKKHLENEHCEEIILSKNYEQQIIVSASSGTGMSHVLDTMLGSGEGKGLTIAEIPESFVGKSFSELFAYFRGAGEGLLIGLLENIGNFYLRKQEALSEAQKNPDIPEIVNNLKRVKEMKSNRTILAPGEKYTVKKYSKAILVCGSRVSEGESI